MAKVHGGHTMYNGRNGIQLGPNYKAPTVLHDDGINVQTTDPSTTNVGYDSPFTPIPA